MDMYKIFKVIRLANTVNNVRKEKNKALMTISGVTHHIETMHEAREVTTHIVNKEVGREDLHYVIRAGKRYGPGVANRVYARYMMKRAQEAQDAAEAAELEVEEIDE